MAVALDHFFICTDPGAPEAALLIDFGLTEGAPNQHPGQGTACRRFFFRNAMLELVWMDNPADAQSDLIRPTMLWERWSRRSQGASPFGVAVHPFAAADTAPFSAWQYRPPYLPAPLAIHVAAGAPLDEPMWFYMDFAGRPDHAPLERRQPLDHPCGFQEVTGLRIASPSPLDSDAAIAMIQAGIISARSHPEHLLEVSFDGGEHRQSRDFRPRLPLLFQW